MSALFEPEDEAFVALVLSPNKLFDLLSNNFDFDLGSDRFSAFGDGSLFVAVKGSGSGVFCFTFTGVFLGFDLLSEETVARPAGRVRINSSKSSSVITLIWKCLAWIKVIENQQKDS